MPAPADLFADLRRLERLASAAGADDRWLGAVIERMTLLCMGVPVGRVDALLRAQQLVERGLAVKIACSRAGLSRDAYYRMLQILQHHPCEPRAIDLEEPRMARVVKTVNIKDAGDVRPPRDTAGKPPYTPPAAPRASGGESTGSTGGNFDAGSLTELPNGTPSTAWDKESKK